MLNGGYQLIDLSGVTFVNHETYLATADDDEVATKKAAALIDAIKSARGRKPLIVGGTIKISTTETVEDEEVTTVEERVLLPIVPDLAESEDETAIVVLPENYILEEANFLRIEAGIAILPSLL